MAGHGLLDQIVMAVKLVADGCPDKVGTIGVEPLLYEEVDVTKVNIAEVDRYLLTFARLRSKLADIVGHRLCHLVPIQLDGKCGAMTNVQAFGSSKIRN